jgi:hypothetical protein
MKGFVMDTVDILIHMHPDLGPETRSRVEQEIMACTGVIAANFNHHQQPHALTVLYDPDAVKDQQILEVARRVDPAATMAGL